MPVTLNSTRFGEVEIADARVIEFPNGLIGLGGRRYALIDDGSAAGFRWLHSLEDPSLALPVMSPWPIFTDYAVEISDDTAEHLGIANADDVGVYVTVRASENPAETSVNLRAPILIDGTTGHQVINESPAAPVRAFLFPEGAEAQADTARAGVA